MRRRTVKIVKTGSRHNPRPGESLPQWWKRFCEPVSYQYTNRFGIRITQLFQAELHNRLLNSLVASGYCTRLFLTDDFLFDFMNPDDIPVEQWLTENDVDLDQVVVFGGYLYLQDDTLHAILRLKLGTLMLA